MCRAPRELGHLLVLHLADQRLDLGRHPPPPPHPPPPRARPPHSLTPRFPSLFNAASSAVAVADVGEQLVGVGDRRVAAAAARAGRVPYRPAPDRPARSRRGRRAGRARSRAGPAGADPAPARGSSRSARRTCGPGRLGDPVVAARVRNPSRNSGGSAPARRRRTGARASNARAELATQVDEEVRLDDGDGEPLPVRALVHVVAGVAAGEDAVTRPGFGAGREVLVDEQGHHRDHAVDDRDVEIRPLAGRVAVQQRGEDRHDRVHPPAAPSPTVAPGIAGRPSLVTARAVEVSAHAEVAEVVAGPLRDGPPGRTRWWSSRRSPG